MIKFALNIKLRYMLRKVLFLLFFIGFLVSGNLIAQTNTSGNNCPVANDDGNIVNEGEITVGNVFDNDTDADGDLLQIVSIIKLPDLSLIHI